MGPHLGPLHHHLVPFGTPSGTPYPLSHRGRVPRGVLIPMCHVTKCSSDPFTLIPTRRYRTGYGSSDGVYPWGDPHLTPSRSPPDPLLGHRDVLPEGLQMVHPTIYGDMGSQRGAIRVSSRPQRGWEWAQMGSLLGPFWPVSDDPDLGSRSGIWIRRGANPDMVFRSLPPDGVPSGMAPSVPSVGISSML